MNRRHALGWVLILGGGAFVLFWSVYGRAYFRRTRHALPEIAEARRTESAFVAILIPRIRRSGERFTITPAQLARVLGGLKASGHTPITLDDVEALYARGRLLPRKAVLVAFSENDPRGYRLSDRVLRNLRWRGTAFVKRTADGAGDEERQYLTGHAIAQMRRSGAWEFGWTATDLPGADRAAKLGRALLVEENRPAVSSHTARFPLAFHASELGYNDRHDAPSALHILVLRPERAAQNLAIVEKAWPRVKGIADDFQADTVGTDWIAGWGVLPMGRHRLKLLPTPRHSSAGIYLRGTETWRDSTVEFNLARYKKEFWAYARLREGESFVRVGAVDGWWHAEQKAGLSSPVNMLARYPIGEHGLPATVRFVLKGDALLVYAGGRLIFGRPLRLNPAIDRGRVFFGVYDSTASAAMAVLNSVRAAPLGEVWLSPVDLSKELDEPALAALREEAAHAKVVSPPWVSVGRDAEVRVRESQSVLLRSMAGFYGCLLVPAVDVETGGLAAGADAADRLARRLAAAADELEVSGLNLRLRADQARSPAALAVASKLRGLLRTDKRELWITLDGAPAPGLGVAADGVLRRSPRSRPSLLVYEGARTTREAPAAPAAAVRSASADLTPEQWEAMQ